MKLKKLLNEDRAGASTFEFALTAPWTLAMMFLVFAFMMVCFSWASFSSLASNVASDLNVRQTGIARAQQMVTNAGGETTAIQCYVVDGQGLSKINPNQINVVCGNAGTEKKIKDATIVAMNKNRKQFQFPFTSFDGITVTVKRPNGAIPSYTEASQMSSNNFASSIIQVDISYRFLPVNSFSFGWSGFPMTVSAKSIVT